MLEDGCFDQNSIESLAIGVDRVHMVLVALVDRIPGLESNLPLVELVTNIVSTLPSPQESSSGFAARYFHSGERGRPRFIIPQDMLEYLIGSRFSVPQIAQLLQTSVSTIRRRMQEFGLTIRSTYSSISDEELDRLVSDIQYRHPNCGYRLLRGHLAAMGQRVQENRIRESLRRIDPVGVMSRWLHSVQRRRYSVPGSNMLWHIDGNHGGSLFDMDIDISIVCKHIEVISSVSKVIFHACIHGQIYIIISMIHAM